MNINDFLDFADCIRGAFNLLGQAADMVEDGQDGPGIDRIKRIIEHKMLVHKKAIYTPWFLGQIRNAEAKLADYDSYKDAVSF